MWASYYEQGTAVWDITDPALPSLIGHYLRTSVAKTSIWGVYPYTGIEENTVVYSSDIENGLQVLALEGILLASLHFIISSFHFFIFFPVVNPVVEGGEESALSSGEIALMILMFTFLASTIALAAYLFKLKRSMKEKGFVPL